MNETQYRKNLIDKLKQMFPGSVIFKNDPTQLQGVPDLLILYKRTWAMLEIKIGDLAKIQPNQKHHVKAFNEMSFASFINPSTEKDVLNALQQTFRSSGKTRVSKSK